VATPAIENIGLITSGGDCGGLNAVLKGAALTAHARGLRALVIPNGYAGLYNLVDMTRLVDLDPGLRCGQTSAYDVNFGMQAGAAAVRLLLAGTTGVTIADVRGGEAFYMPTKRAIEPRHVDPGLLALFEEMGFNFGRQPHPYQPTFTELAENEPPARHL